MTHAVTAPQIGPLTAITFTELQDGRTQVRLRITMHASEEIRRSAEAGLSSALDRLAETPGGTMNITGVDFITVPTQDFDKASEFYGGVLGLERSKQWGSMPAAEYETGTLTIAVMQSDAFGIEFAPHTHPIALHVDDVEAARAELEAQGVKFAGDTMDSGVCHMAHFRDPDGNTLMFHNRYAPVGQAPG